MSAHKHAATMLQYAEDAAKTNKPWELWEYQHEHESESNWHEIIGNPAWHEKIKYRRKPVKWQPVGGEYYVDSCGDVYEGYPENRARYFGIERPTKEQAERAAVEMRRFNRLLALRDELCGDDVVDFEKPFCEIYFDTIEEKWIYGLCSIYKTITPHFTTEESAQRACDMLNSGEVEL